MCLYGSRGGIRTTRPPDYESDELPTAPPCDIEEPFQDLLRSVVRK